MNSTITLKLKHNKNFDTELKKARQIAKFALKYHSRSSKSVSHLGLPSAISNQILKKYSNNKKLKKISSVKLTIPNQGIKLVENTIKISCLKLEIPFEYYKAFEKIVQIEIDNKFYYVSLEIKDNEEIKVKNYLGVDRNTTGHCAVVAMPHNGKVIKLGKNAFHIHRKYKKIRKHLQIKKAFKKLKKISKREKNIIKDINHKISRKIVEIALENNCGIKLENLKGIRKNKKIRSKKKNKSGESFKSSINSWEFYQLEQMIKYKAKICGIPVIHVAPHYTSQNCSRCGLFGNRTKKKFSCPHCGHVDHADSNAAFNIALKAEEESSNNTEGNGQSAQDRDCAEGNTDIPQLEMQHLKLFSNVD